MSKLTAAKKRLRLITLENAVTKAQRDFDKTKEPVKRAKAEVALERAKSELKAARRPVRRRVGFLQELFG